MKNSITKCPRCGSQQWADADGNVRPCGPCRYDDYHSRDLCPRCGGRLVKDSSANVDWHVETGLPQCPRGFWRDETEAEWAVSGSCTDCQNGADLLTDEVCGSCGRASGDAGASDDTHAEAGHDHS